MKYILQLALLMTISATITTAYAETHSHGGRTHNHPLPVQGISHKHRGGALGEKVGVDSSAQNNKKSDTKHRVVQSRGKQQDKFHPASYDYFKKIISGNTLIVKSPRVCVDKNSTKQCIAILLLKENHTAITIFPDKKEVVTGKWGLTTYNFNYAVDLGEIIMMPYDSSQYPFSSIVSINTLGTIVKITPPKRRYVYNFSVQKGINNKFLKLAKSKSFKQIEIAGRKTFGEAVLGAVVKSVGKAMKEGGSSSNLALNSSFCGVNDTCYKYLKSKKSGAAIVRCTKGSYTGQEKCLSFKKGKYATGCGLSDAFAHHYTLKKAANRACGQ